MDPTMDSKTAAVVITNHSGGSDSSTVGPTTRIHSTATTDVQTIVMAAATDGVANGVTNFVAMATNTDLQ